MFTFSYFAYLFWQFVDALQIIDFPNQAVKVALSIAVSPLENLQPLAERLASLSHHRALLENPPPWNLSDHPSTIILRGFGVATLFRETPFSRTAVRLIAAVCSGFGIDDAPTVCALHRVSDANLESPVDVC